MAERANSHWLKVVCELDVGAGREEGRLFAQPHNLITHGCDQVIRARRNLG